MAKSKYVLTEKQIVKRINEGWDSGERLSDYIGRDCMLMRSLQKADLRESTGRIHHILSDFEF